MYKKTNLIYGLSLFCITATVSAQQTDPIVDAIVKEATTNSHLPKFAFELTDVIGPRLVGSPQMQQAHDWVVSQYTALGIPSKNEAYGVWKSWQRGTTQIEMTSPRIKSIEGMQLAWSPATKSKGVEAEVITLPQHIQDSLSFAKWLPQVKGKIVLVSMPQPTGRPDHQWKEFATSESFDKMKNDRDLQTKQWNQNIKNTGYNNNTLAVALEKAGAQGIVMSQWAGAMGANRIFGAKTTKIPTVDISLEDYGTFYRLAENGLKPKMKITANSKDLGQSKTYNTVSEIKGSTLPNEYIILSAHLDSWDGGTGATDNATGIITMIEAARILKKVLPNNKRTIIIGNWGSEEQGLNGSRAFVADHPEIIKNTVAVFNQDSGTGRTVSLNGQGFLHSYKFLGSWLDAVPADIRNEIKTTYPGAPSSGGSDHASFVAAGAPAFMLGAQNWGYGPYTWHTQRDTYDKIVFDDVQKNAILIAILAYKASEDPNQISKERIDLGKDNKGNDNVWPEVKEPNRSGKY